MDRLDFLPRQPHAPQHPLQARWTVRLGKMHVEPAAQDRVASTPRHRPSAVGTAEDGGGERRFVGFAQFLRWVAPRPIPSARPDPRHWSGSPRPGAPVASSRRSAPLPPRHPLKRVAIALKPGRHPPAVLPSRQQPQLHRRSIIPNAECPSHSLPISGGENGIRNLRCRESSASSHFKRFSGII